MEKGRLARDRFIDIPTQFVANISICPSQVFLEKWKIAIYFAPAACRLPNVVLFLSEPTRKRKKREELEYNNKASPTTPVNSDNVVEDTDAKSKKKKARTTFTGRQIFELEKQFEMKKYLSSSERSEMAKLLNVTETQVRTLVERTQEFELIRVQVAAERTLLRIEIKIYIRLKSSMWSIAVAVAEKKCFSGFIENFCQ